MKNLLYIFSLIVFFEHIWCMEGPTEKKEVKLILLNGASCTGKTTLAIQLTDYIVWSSSRYVVHESFDNFCKRVVEDDYYMDRETDRLQSKGIELPTNYGQKMFAIFHNQLLEKLKAGKMVVADHCFLHKESYPNFCHVFKEYCKNVALIKVFCTYEVAQERLKKRNAGSNTNEHRNEGFVKNHFFLHSNTIYGDKEYEGGVNTTSISPKEGALKIMDILQIDREGIDDILLLF